MAHPDLRIYTSYPCASARALLYHSLVDSQSNQPIEFEILEELEDDLGESFAEFLQLFLEQMPQRLARLRVAVESNDADAAREASHSIKSSAGYVGATQLMQVSAEIERRARENTLQEVETLVSRAESLYKKVHEVLADRY